MKDKHFNKKTVTVTVLTLALMLQTVTPAIALTDTTLDMGDTITIEQEYGVDALTNDVYGANTAKATTTTAPASFKDLKSSHWAHKNIQTLVNLGGIKGYPDGSFKPEGTITYAELCSILLGATGTNTTAPGGTNWAQFILSKSYDAKIADNKAIPLADANKAVKRDVMSMVLSNSATELRGENLSTLKDIDKYVRDWGSVGTKYQTYVNKCVANGLIQGDTSSNFKPSSNLTRAEAATICLRLIDTSTRLTPSQYANEGNYTSDGYKIVAEGTDIRDYTSEARTIRSLTDTLTGESNYRVLENGDKFELKLSWKQKDGFMIEYKNPGKVLILDKSGNLLGRSIPHTVGDNVRDAFGVDLSKVKYFAFASWDAGFRVTYIVPNTLQ